MFSYSYLDGGVIGGDFNDANPFHLWLFSFVFLDTLALPGLCIFRRERESGINSSR
jgi:hypothetical protein